ncbi:hypothetical protein J6590_059271 [Homalodisca vitripennis]|nr:hypothetical protein J6590_059271 [Homalodisca vitripennis]
MLSRKRRNSEMKSLIKSTCVLKSGRSCLLFMQIDEKLQYELDRGKMNYVTYRVTAINLRLTRGAIGSSKSRDLKPSYGFPDHQFTIYTRRTCGDSPQQALAAVDRSMFWYEG